jgi:hypothetical protein
MLLKWTQVEKVWFYARIGADCFDLIKIFANVGEL